MNKKRKRTMLNIDVSQQMLDDLDRVAAEESTEYVTKRRADIVRQALAEWLERRKQEEGKQ